MSLASYPSSFRGLQVETSRLTKSAISWESLKAMRRPRRTVGTLGALSLVLGAFGGALVMAQPADGHPRREALSNTTARSPRCPATCRASVPSPSISTRFGNEVTLAPSSLAVGQVTVTMSSQACETGGGVTCVTTPGATFPETFTLNLYNVDPGPTVGSLITTLTQTVNIPFRPSADPINCTGGDAGIGSTRWRACATPALATNVVFDLSAAKSSSRPTSSTASGTTRQPLAPTRPACRVRLTRSTWRSPKTPPTCRRGQIRTLEPSSRTALMPRSIATMGPPEWGRSDSTHPPVPVGTWQPRGLRITSPPFESAPSPSVVAVAVAEVARRQRLPRPPRLPAVPTPASRFPTGPM